ncbi:hypothetical protein AWW66_26700 [Micromonospora rosaria]|uniref:NACHT domain-containing protein n=1 Tax=Micromonospora rosaria TaxID=47874 RepID=A0A136PKP9_9ACTN|nr:NACHT domain-containing protein [Micromonospora rosaria]KXK58995.1 hypothetical protein AWW66_26700 [Micromonospora rosaria]
MAFTVCILVAATGIGLAYVQIHDLERAADWAQLFSLVLALVPLAAWWRAGGRTTGTTPDQSDRAQRALATAVLRQWRNEIVLRQLDDPMPLAVRWRLVEFDRRERVSSQSRPDFMRSLLRIGRRRFEGRTDDIAVMVDAFRKLDPPRLVILGEPGMGKTTLASLLLRELLKDNDATSQVPVLFSLSGWRATEESLHDWLARRLATDYPMLRAAEFGTDAPRALVTDRRILPILDGLDEMPDSLRPAAISEINAVTTRDDAVVVTCRTAEYEATLALGAGVRGGAVIVPLPPRPADVVAYLTSLLRSQHGRRHVWSEVLQELATGRPTPLAVALATPLNLWLLRKIYIDSDNDPRTLRNRTTFPNPGAITGYLLDHLTTTLVSAGRPGIPATSSRRMWRPEDAQRWLSFLACHLDRTGSRDLAWWQLRQSVTVRPVHRAVTGAALGLVFALLSGATAGLVGLALDVPRLAATTGLVGGFMVGLAFGLAADTTATPAYADLRLRPERVSSLLRTVGYATVTWLAIGVAVGVLLTITGVEVGAVGPTIIGTAFGLVYGFMVWVATPVTDYRVQSPASVLRGDLQLALVRTMVFVLVGGTVAALTATVMGGAAPYVVFALATAFMVALIVGAPPKVASSVYLSMTVILARRGRSPLRLMRFLEYAHQLGLLRQNGPVYQFRHAMLQHRLAQACPCPARPTDPV